MKTIYYGLLLATQLLISHLGKAQELPRGASFGAAVTDLTDSSRQVLQMTSTSGTLIQQVLAGSSAQQAGFSVNDVLVSINREPIANTNAFLQKLKSYHGGDVVTIGYYHEGTRMEKTMTLLPRKKESSELYDIIYSSVWSGTNQLKTIITKPKGKGPFPAVLLIGGVGCYSIDRPVQPEIQSFTLWSDSLTRNGFVTMRVEKTGMGDSKGIPCADCDFHTERLAYSAGLKQLKSLAYTDGQSVFIAGFSIGGVIAPLLAQEDPVKGIIVYGTVGKNWLEYELDNSLRQQLLAHPSADSLDQYMRAEYIRLYSLFVEKKEPDEMVREHPETKQTLFPYPMRLTYFQQVADLNIRALWMKTEAPVLVMHGSADFVSSASEHQLIAALVNRYHAGQATYLEIAHADHWEFDVENEWESTQHQITKLNPAPVIQSIAWLKKQS